MKYKELMQLLLNLHSTTPNDAEFGKQVRLIVWKHIEDNNPAY